MQHWSPLTHIDCGLALSMTTLGADLRILSVNDQLQLESDLVVRHDLAMTRALGQHYFVQSLSVRREQGFLVRIVVSFGATATVIDAGSKCGRSNAAYSQAGDVMRCGLKMSAR